VKILLIEDSPSDTYLFREMLLQSKLSDVEIESVDRLSSGLQRLADGKFDAVLLDLGLPDSQGLDSLVKLVDLAPNLPTIVLTGQSDEELAVQAVQMGAQDYLFKNQMTGDILGRVIRYAIERKQVETELRTERDRAQQYLNVAGVMFVAVNADQTVSLINEAGCRILGYPEEEILGRNWFDHFLHVKDIDTVKNVFDSNMRGESSLVEYYENPVLCRDGREKIISWHNVILYDGAGNAVGTLSAGEDISGRKEAENALIASEERLRFITDQVTDLIWVMDLELNFVFATPSVTRLLGYTVEEFLSLSMRDVLPPAALEEASRLIAERARETTREPQTVEMEQICKDGSTKWCEVTSVFSVDEKGNVTGIIGVTRDITARLKAEEEKKKLEAQLQLVQRMEALGTLAGGIAHDFNNILSAVIGFSEIALSEIEPGTLLHDNIGEILKAGQRARDLVRQILAFSRQAEQERMSLDLIPIITEVLKLLRATLPATIEINQRIDWNLKPVIANPTEIHQIVMNLCTNAGHAMRQHGGVLGIELSIAEPNPAFTINGLEITPDSFIRLTVSDTGDGIDPEIAKRIFEPFFTTKKIGEGTGMGLSVVHGIVKSLGGDIRVKSELGQGSAFEVYLPVSNREEFQIAISDEGPIGGNERILFVDDEPALINIGQQMLERLGYEVVCCMDSLEALKLFREESDRFDLVITDMTMPGVTGDELAGEVMRIKPGIPVILCTGFSERIKENKARDLGICGFLMKPLLMKSVARAIRQALDERSN